jgi:hypothetical protein
MNERPDPLEFTRLLLRLKKAGSDGEKAELYGSLSEEAKELADYHKQQSPDFVAPLEIKDHDTF